MARHMIDIDADHNETPINWKAVAESGVEAVMIKATQGDKYVNPFGEQNAWDALRAGIHDIGFYHFFDPAFSAFAQVEHFNATTLKWPHSIGKALDAEETINNADGSPDWTATSSAVEIILPRMDAKFKTLYFNENWAANLQDGFPYGALEWFSHPFAKSPAPFKPTFAWQYTWTGRVPGIAAAVDMNWLYL